MSGVKSRREKVRFKTGFKSIARLSNELIGRENSSGKDRPIQKTREASEDLAQGGTARR